VVSCTSRTTTYTQLCRFWSWFEKNSVWTQNRKPHQNPNQNGIFDVRFDFCIARVDTSPVDIFLPVQTFCKVWGDSASFWVSDTVAPSVLQFWFYFFVDSWVVLFLGFWCIQTTLVSNIQWSGSLWIPWGFEVILGIKSSVFHISCPYANVTAIKSVTI
jgi:hypothetical protein